MTCHLEPSYRRLTGKQATTSDSSRGDCKSSGAIFRKRAVFLVESSSFDWASFSSPQPGSQTAQPDYLSRPISIGRFVTDCHQRSRLAWKRLL